MTKTAIITGSMGYIGSHTAKLFREAGWIVIGVDRSNTIPEAANYIDQLLVDDYVQITATAAEVNRADAIIHCAGSSLVGPSIKDPTDYYNNNSARTNSLLGLLAKRKWSGNFVFSSTAATYGTPKLKQMCVETDYTRPINPYGWSKLYCERIIEDHCTAHNMRGVALRYFNAAGADLESKLGHIKEDSHLIPRILTAYQKGVDFELYGNDYATHDGTCVRDYLHVHDIARAHLIAAEMSLSAGQFEVFNLGTNQGLSNLEIIKSCESIVNDTIKYRVVNKRPGDPDYLVANSTKFMNATQWIPIYSDIETIVKSAWNWQKRYKL